MASHKQEHLKMHVHVFLIPLRRKMQVFIGTDSREGRRLHLQICSLSTLVKNLDQI